VHVYVCVVESESYTKLKKLDVQGGKKDKLFADLVTQVCKAHNWVIVSFPGLCPSRSPAGASRCEANHRGVEGEHRVQCARVRRSREEHTLIERATKLGHVRRY